MSEQYIECRECVSRDLAFAQSASPYANRPPVNCAVGQHGLCSEHIAARSAQQPADLAPGTTTLTFNVDDLPEYQPTIRTHAHELARDPRDVELERLKEFAAAFWRPVATDMEHGILSIDTVRFIAQDFLSALHDRAYMEFPREAALQTSPERPAADTDNDA